MEPPEAGVVMDPREWFESPGELELEIGCGKGGFLLRRAQSHPERNLLGIEWANKFHRFAADRMARWGVANVRVMRTDAGHFVQHHLPPACLTVLHTYHPDPWPKKRHHKRRLIQPALVEAAVRAMAPGARWAIQTDHAEYFALIKCCVLGHTALRETRFDEPEYGVQEELTGTNFEIKYLREGRTIHRLAVVKRK